MIHLSRPAVPVGLVEAAKVEVDAWREYVGGSGEKPEFSAYKIDSVKDALRTLSGGKCMYCESSVTHVASMHIEHWRPKGKIRPESTDDVDGLIEGYGWLAADWDNLLYACPHCNCPTHHKDATGGMTSGKGMRFPLKQPRQECPKEHDELTEEPLLLNPCDARPEKYPEKHLRLPQDVVTLGVISPVDTETGDPSELGQKSIEVFALNREDLVAKRRKHFTNIRIALSSIRVYTRMIEMQASLGDDPELKSLISDNLETLKEYLLPSTEFTLLSRQVIGPFLTSIGITPE